MDLLALWPHLSKVGMIVAAMLLFAVAGIQLTRMAHVPRVLGYLFFGIVLHWLLGVLITDDRMVEGLIKEVGPTSNMLKAIALCLIMFAIGTQFDGKHLRTLRNNLWKIVVCDVFFVGAAIFLAVWALHPEHNIFIAAFLAIAGVSTAPAATVHVIRQYGAKGPVSDHLIAMTGLNNLLAVTTFYVVFLLLADRGLISISEMKHPLGTALLLSTVGSAMLGFIFGLGLSIAHVILSRFESVMVFFAIVIGISSASPPIGLNALIFCIFMGIAFTNFSIQPQSLLADLQPLWGPILAMFFLLSGFKLDFGSLKIMGVVGIGYLLTRATAKIVGVWIGVKWAKPGESIKPDLGVALLCQGGVSIGLARYLMEHWGTMRDGRFEPAPEAYFVETVVLASVVIFEMLGSLTVKRAVVRAGEVKAVSLLSRPAGSLREVRTIMDRLMRSLHLRSTSTEDVSQDMLAVRHAMRTNVECLEDTQKMSDVLRFVEHSRLNHFYVVDSDGRFVGTIDFADLRNMMFNPIMAQMLTAYDMANTAPPLARPDQALRDVLAVFHEHDLGSLPVVDDAKTGRLLGIIEQRDVLRALHEDAGDLPFDDDH
jgi:CBS domain-containing protein